jgi:natural product biosynthesis luciferase-like monooxygenase protein
MSATGRKAAWFVGEGSLLIQAAGIWREFGHPIEGIASREPSVLTWAHAHGIPVVPFEELGPRAAEKEFDYLFSVVNLVVLPEKILALPKKLAINFHDGYLPGYAGVNVPVWAILNEQPKHGITFHIMTGGADEGDILVQRAFDIAPDETAFSLNAKCFAAGIETFRELTEQITAGTLAPVPQNLGERRYFGFYDRPAAAMVLDFAAGAEAVARTVRALDFGGYPNPVGAPKILVGGEALIVSEATVEAGKSGSPAGTVVSADGDALVVATGSNDVKLGRLRTAEGTALHAADLAGRGLRAGVTLGALDEAARARLTAANGEAAKSEGHFQRLLAHSMPLTFSLGKAGAPEPVSAHKASVKVPAGLDGKRLPALFLAFAARKSGLEAFDLGYADPDVRARQAVSPAIFAGEVPLRLSIAPDATLAAIADGVDGARRKVGARQPFARDLLARQHHLPRALPVTLLVDVAPAGAVPASDLEVAIDTSRATLALAARSDKGDAAGLGRFAHRLELFLEKAATAGDSPLRAIQTLSREEEQKLDAWNATDREVPAEACVHTLFEAQVRRTPDRVAVTARNRSLTYRELDRRANAMARELRAAGVGPDVLVGIFVERGLDMVVSLLAVHKAGGAYVPLDPNYPAERLKLYIEDSKAAVVITDPQNEPALPAGGYTKLLVSEGRFDAGEHTPPDNLANSSHLAYVIYTSGSTGKPKGVMVEHRNVVNFLVAMDDVLRPGEAAGTWLAVTSLSFDISVLELLWTLTRGFHVVVHPGEARVAAPVKRPLDFSVFYFASAASGGPENYRLLLEGAKFADENGFAAVWTPERHFHAFGGLYPNPAVTNAALAMITKRTRLRAGSCVSPLHSPLRIAEEWSFVDNLSNGRVDISFASGWQPNDFALKPEAFAKRKEQMFEDIETIRRLWKGEGVAFKNGVGKDITIQTLPRPVQKELPVWITSAANPETFEQAGRVGANVLTHLLGQSFAEVADKIKIYRAARQKAGHSGRGVVTLMLHTFIGKDEDIVREAVRKPMKEYLRSAVGLIKEAAWSFPTFKAKFDDGTFSPDKLSAEEMDTLLDHAFERYYKQSGLFGTVDSALEVVEQVRSIDADEIACLIDFGVPDADVIASFPLMAELREKANRAAVAAPTAESAASSGQTIPELFASERVTHFQCTPSMASMLVLDDDSRKGISGLQAMLVGGEALPVALARDLTGLIKNGKLINVYGPTETTVWSSSHVVTEVGDEIPIGKPLANTDLLIIDAMGALAAPGEEGELLIGGKGVVRGYLHRPELTKERFIPHPRRTGERAYRTGDLASFRDDGVVRFGGRLDHQVKIRGYRIEIGEIEARLGEHPGVRECVVVAREDTPGDKRLVGYVIPRAGAIDGDEVRKFLLERLPEYMVPTTFVSLATFPQTPNRKIDRKALPAPKTEAPAAAASAEPREKPGSTLEETIAVIWRELLNRSQVGVTDNFFDLGGHSLLTIQLLGRLKQKVDKPVSLVDLFRYPTIRSLATFLESSGDASAELDGSMARGAERQRIRRAMADKRRR